MALEHPGEDEVPDRAVAEPRDLDEHHGPGRLVLAVVGQRAAAVDVDRHVQVGAGLPQRLVVVLPQRRAGASWAGWTATGCPRRARRRSPWPSAPRPPRRRCRWRRPARCRPAVRARLRRSRPASGCAPAPRPSGARSPRAWAAGPRGCPPRRRAGRYWGRAPRPRCRRTRSRPGGARCPSCGRRSAARRSAKGFT